MPIIQNQWQFLCRPLFHLSSSRHNFTSFTALPRRTGRIWYHHSIVNAIKLPTPPNNVQQLVENTFDVPKVETLKQKMELLGIDLDNSCLPGQYQNLFCPKCKGGQLKERSLSFHIIPDGAFAMWRCFRTTCGWSGQAFADDQELDQKVSADTKPYGQITEESLGLEPLGPKLIAYFNERLISEKTLSRNNVMQLSGNKTVVAFTYKRNGLLAGCKYRTLEKRFWQEKGTDRTLYGLDDISDAVEVIIVEGEIDKLSLEEAGFQNCVSVPVGAPVKFSSKELPPIEKDNHFLHKYAVYLERRQTMLSRHIYYFLMYVKKLGFKYVTDTAYQYLWHCREYLDKVDRIILATDNDRPGQALAEELARRLGRERCWQVCWPKKDAINSFKDANEVLRYMGAGALKRIVENAKLYQPKLQIK